MALRAAGFLDRLHHLGADVAHRGEAVADVLADSHEVLFRLINIRLQHRNAKVTAVRQVDRGLVFLVANRRQQRRHVLSGVIRLHVGRPVRHQRVASGVRLVKRVGRERLDRAPQRVHRCLGVPVLLHAAPELVVLLGEHLGFLLTHRFTEAVCLAGRVICHLLRDTHDLLLVHDEAIGLVENFAQRLVQLRVDRGDRLTPVLTVRVVPVRVHTHRTRAVERQRRHDVLKAGRLHAFEQLLHAAGVQLEHAEGLAAGEQLVHGCVVCIQRFQVERFAAVLLYVLQGVAKHRKVAQAQEVHLQQADGLAGRVIPAGDDRAVRRALPHRDVVHERHGRHDHRAGVHAGLAHDALEAASRLVDFGHIRVRLDQ